jgi:MYXO-CTERM domain-containing protein
MKGFTISTLLGAENLPKHLYNYPYKLHFMKRIIPLLLFLILLFLLGQASASYWFVVTDVTPIRMEPNSDANFTVTVKGLGSQGAYVQVIFRNMSEGLSIASSDRLRYVFPTGTTKFNFTLHAGDIVPGNYSFEAGTAAVGSPPGWKKAYVDVVAAGAMATGAEEMIEVTPPGKETTSQNVSAAPEAEEAPAETAQERGMPGPGAALAVIALLLAARRRRS